MKLSNALKISAAGLMLGAAVRASSDYLIIRKKERAKRELIEANRLKELDAISAANLAMLKSIQDGDAYFGPDAFDRMMEDFGFEPIRAFNQM